MNKISIFLLFLTIISINVNGQDENSEPLMNLDIYVNGEKFQIKDGDTLNISNTQIVVKSSDFMTFDFGVVSFDYPKYFAYSFEEDFAYKNWTLDGNDLVIMYFEIGAEAELDMFIKEMVKQFGRKNCNVIDHFVKIGDLDLKGKRINVEIIGQKITYDMYKLESNDFKSHFIAFQDSKNEDGLDSKESIETLNIINETIQYK
ncbi:hypothetical protein C9994_03560 [Marivirga lumbricoides]|uniref:Uncharacterized protein n=1 Tax=Marivirga lumbricoides TaxID=1046115 RepID=A0A2T4DU25_9BACT|nr:hypothetical protein C9994_03560 [Marivirga lumbricoides]